MDLCRVCRRRPLAKAYPGRKVPTTCGRPACRGKAAAWTRGHEAMAAMGKIGGKRARHETIRGEEWNRGYKAGWVASERFFLDRYEVIRRKPGRQPMARGAA